MNPYKQASIIAAGASIKFTHSHLDWCGPAYNQAEVMGVAQRLFPGHVGFLCLPHKCIRQPLTHQLPLSQGPITITLLESQLSLCLSEQSG